MKNRILLYLCVFVYSLFFLTGCKLQNKEIHVTETEVSQQEYTGNWKEDGFYINEDFVISLDRSTATLLEADYSFMELPQVDFSYTASNVSWGYLSDTVYAVVSYTMQDSQQHWLYYRSFGEKKYKQVQLALNQELIGNIVRLDIIDEENIALLFAEGSNNIENYHVFLTNTTGIVNKTIKIDDAYMQDMKELFAEQGSMLAGFFACNNDNICFLTDAFKSYLYAFDEQGNLLTKADYTTNDHSLAVEDWFHMEDGSVVISLEHSNPAYSELIWYDASKKIFKTLKELPHRGEGFVFSDGGKITYIANSVLYEWNLATGKHDLLFGFLDSKLEINNLLGLGRREKEVIIYIKTERGIECNLLSDEIETTENSINIANIAYGSSYVKGAAASYTRKYSNTQFVYNDPKGETDDYRTQVMAELSAQKGPDMLWVNSEDLKILAKQGVLLDLTELISKETLEQIFPGIIEHGTVDGKYVGVQLECQSFVAMTADSLWKEEYITNKQIQELLNQSDTLKSIYINDNYESFSSSSNQNHMLMTLQNSEFIDLDNGVCYFASNDFVSLLETIKEYSQRKDFEAEEYQRLTQGEAIGVNCHFINIIQFCSTMRMLDEDCHFVSWPEQTNGIGYFNDGEMLVVNAKSEHLDEIKGFLEYLLSCELQRTTDYTCVRADAIRQNVIYNEFYDMSGQKIISCVFRNKESGGSSGWVLETKPEGGGTYTEEFIEYLNTCSAYPQYPKIITDIIEEESKMFFEGMRSAEDTAAIIQNRVQLYLDEQN